jgi:hypothetical protein
MAVSKAQFSSETGGDSVAISLFGCTPTLLLMYRKPPSMAIAELRKSVTSNKIFPTG